MDTSKIEVEAKFIIPDPATFAALRELRHLDGFELKPLGTKTVVDCYLDTAKQGLYRAGLACRLRSVKDKQIITLKSLMGAATEIHRRQEIEVEVETDDFQAGQPLEWPDNDAKKVVVEIIGSALLQPMFTLYQTRHQFHVLWQNQPVIEFSLDEVSLHDPVGVDYRELEAELLEPGSEADLARFIAALQAIWPLQAETRSKFERALEAATFKGQAKKIRAIPLSHEEKSTLGNIANGANELRAKRALIILMSETGQLATADIAGEVGLSPRTVRRWQRAFGEKRLGIFPTRALYHRAGNSSTRSAEKETSVEAQTGLESPVMMEMINEGPSVPDTLPIITYPVRYKIGLEPTDTLAEAGRKVLGFHFARMLQHEPGTRQGDDIEALHDMRVAARRMRAAFRVFGDAFSKKVRKSLIAGLRATRRALGQVRDLDVFIEALQAYQQSLPESEQTSLQPLLDVWSSKREEARQKMLAYLDSRKYLKFKQNFLEFVTTEGLGAKAIPSGIPTPYQLRHLVPGLIYQRYEAVHAYEVVLDNATIDTLHQLRIAFKQLRYAFEFFEEILGDERAMVIKEVKILQDHLGNLNDAHVASELLRDFLVKWDQHQLHLLLDQRQSPVHLVAYLNTRLAKRQQLIVTFPNAWADFNGSNFRRNLALAISVL